MQWMHAVRKAKRTTQRGTQVDVTGVIVGVDVETGRAAFEVLAQR